ncbi:MAG: polysaccharide deacetylase [Clostridiales bacterium]|nr:polysaccharide deacetylase [Clostridiales bacterium]
MKRYWFLPLIFLGLFLAIWMARDTLPQKPLQPRIVSPQAMDENMDLAGGPERKVRGFPKRKILDLTSMFPDLFIDSGPREEKLVALTFDDGPDDIFTPQFLDVLKEKNVKATFFIIGKRAEGFPEVMKRIYAESHFVGNHTWSHPNLVKLPLEKVKEEVLKTDRLLQSYSKGSDEDMKIFRSPYGSIDPERVKLIGKLGYKIIAWNVDSLDWKGLSAEEVKTNVLENVTNGSIILQHSAGGTGEDLSGSVKALPQIIDVLRKEGFKFVTITELLEEK